MRYIFSLTAAFAVGLFTLTACHNAAKPIAIEPAKTNSSSTAITAKSDQHAQMDEAPRIDLAEAKKDFDAGNAVFVDTRAEVSYKQEHIKGAINIPAEAAATRGGEIPTGKKIIAYCS